MDKQREARTPKILSPDELREVAGGGSGAAGPVDITADVTHEVLSPRDAHTGLPTGQRM
jgi:hypothetical protein